MTQLITKQVVDSISVNRLMDFEFNINDDASGESCQFAVLPKTPFDLYLEAKLARQRQRGRPLMSSPQNS